MDHADPLPPPRLPASPSRPPVRTGLTDPLRLSAWRGRHDVLLVVPRPGAIAATAHDVGRTTEEARLSGVRRLVTGALSPAEQEPFLASGFTVHDRLHLLRHDLVEIPSAPSVTPGLRRARRPDHDEALAVDARAFDRFWRLDRAGLDDALGATSTARFRVAADRRIVGYAVTGRAGDRGYVQRVAVDPQHRGRGLGAALVVDGLRWLRRRRVQSAVVNTQVGNDSALALYRRLGFRPEPVGLTVLTRVLDDRSEPA